MTYSDSKFLMTIGLVSAFLAIGSVKFLRPDYARQKIDKQVSKTQPVAPADTTGIRVR